MRRQRFDGVELALQALVVDGRVHVRMARAAQQRDPLLDVAPAEIALVAAVAVARLGNEVVARELADAATAKLAMAASSDRAAVFHTGRMAHVAEKRRQHRIAGFTSIHTSEWTVPAGKAPNAAPVVRTP